MKRMFSCLVAALLLAACSPQPSQNRYDSRDVGMNATMLFGTVLSKRQVQVTGEDTGTGAIAGGVGGGVAGSLIGSGGGSVLGALAGAVAGGLLGNEAEKSMGNRQGVEYVIALDNGTNQSVVQNVAPDDKPIFVGQRVMVQVNGYYHRVLPVDASQAMPMARPANPQ